MAKDKFLAEIIKRDNEVLTHQKTVESIKAELKDAKDELDAAILSLQEAINEARTGQEKLDL